MGGKARAWLAGGTSKEYCDLSVSLEYCDLTDSVVGIGVIKVRQKEAR